MRRIPTRIATLFATTMLLFATLGVMTAPAASATTRCLTGPTRCWTEGFVYTQPAYIFIPKICEYGDTQIQASTTSTGKPTTGVDSYSFAETKTVSACQTLLKMPAHALATRSVIYVANTATGPATRLCYNTGYKYNTDLLYQAAAFSSNAHCGGHYAWNVSSKATYVAGHWIYRTQTSPRIHCYGSC